MILRRCGRASDAVTGGQGTIGVRMPRHPLALQMIRRFGGGVVTPWADVAAAHRVREELGGGVDFIVDGGPCAVGMEPTLVDLSGGEAAILRRGAVTLEDIERALGRRVSVRGR